MKYRITILAALTGVAVAAVPMSLASSDVHFALSKSMPAADSSIEAPAEVRLWFTEAPERNTVSIRLADGEGNLIESGDLAQDADDARIFSVAVLHTLAAGPYMVLWRAIGDDGHAVRGDFKFAVTQQ